ncbi:MAG: hypothetical protein A3K10_00945 [Bacteroidetes bacterium RIFCSPLOWO2_12_FULL_31_6]|nr:MAG: hypothetical protein A3K10_00945 [Bacteroidetes bacterium RIFCSPLOWO2_12_FULL_31_6]
MHYCAYQERCTHEVKTKLKEYNLSYQIIQEIINKLIEDNFVNDERFCKIYAISKFKHNKWGRLKIEMALKQKMLPNNLIEIGLAEIPEADYKKLIVDLFHSKIKDENISYEEKIKTMQYIASKGFEKDLILTCINSVFK